MVDCKICGHPYCEHAGTQRGIVVNCANYMTKKKPQTNEDRIRSEIKTTEGLAELLVVWLDDWFEYDTPIGHIEDYKEAISKTIEWLRQLVKDGEGDG